MGVVLGILGTIGFAMLLAGNVINVLIPIFLVAGLILWRVLNPYTRVFFRSLMITVVVLVVGVPLLFFGACFVLNGGKMGGF